MEDPTTREENYYWRGTEPQGERARKAQSTSPIILKPPMKKTEANIKKDSQERSGTLKRLPRSGMAGNTKKYIQSVGLHTLFKKNNGKIKDA